MVSVPTAVMPPAGVSPTVPTLAVAIVALVAAVVTGCMMHRVIDRVGKEM